MVSFTRITLIAAGVIALLSVSPATAIPQTQDTSTSTFAGASAGSAAGAGCNIILSDPTSQTLLGCALANVPQNYTSSSQMESALNTYCADSHKCNEASITLFLQGLINSCGADAATNSSNSAYKLFQQMYTAVPGWASYCRKDSNNKYCLLQAGSTGQYGPREHSFTCDECGQLRVETYADWENRTSAKLGSPVAQIDQDLQSFNKKCPNITATVTDGQPGNSSDATNSTNSGSSSAARSMTASVNSLAVWSTVVVAFLAMLLY